MQSRTRHVSLAAHGHANGRVIRRAPHHGLVRPSILCAVVLSVGLAGCGGTDSAERAESGAGEVAETSSPASESGGAEAESQAVQRSESTGGGQQVQPGSAQDNVAQVTARVAEFSVELDRDTVDYGAFSLLIQNDGERPHTIVLRAANGMRWSSIPIPPAGSVTLSMELGPGAYTVSSVMAAYVERGMTAALHVR